MMDYDFQLLRYLNFSFYAFWAVSGSLLIDKFQIRDGAYSPGEWTVHFYQEPSLTS
jgi:hypothetical protein